MRGSPSAVRSRCLAAGQPLLEPRRIRRCSCCPDAGRLAALAPLLARVASRDGLRRGAGCDDSSDAAAARSRRHLDLRLLDRPSGDPGGPVDTADQGLGIGDGQCPRAPRSVEARGENVGACAEARLLWPLQCVECGRVQAASGARGWRAYITADEDEPPRRSSTARTARCESSAADALENRHSTPLRQDNRSTPPARPSAAHAAGRAATYG